MRQDPSPTAPSDPSPPAPLPIRSFLAGEGCPIVVDPQKRHSLHQLWISGFEFAGLTRSKDFLEEVAALLGGAAEVFAGV